MGNINNAEKKPKRIRKALRWKGKKPFGVESKWPLLVTSKPKAEDQASATKVESATAEPRTVPMITDELKDTTPASEAHAYHDELETESEESSLFHDVETGEVLLIFAEQGSAQDMSSRYLQHTTRSSGNLRTRAIRNAMAKLSNKVRDALMTFA